MQQRQVAPGAADGVQSLRSKVGSDAAQFAPDRCTDPRRVERRLEGERAQRQGDPRARLPVGDPDQLQAGAAQVADHALRVRRAGEDAQGGVAGLFAPVRTRRRRPVSASTRRQKAGPSAASRTAAVAAAGHVGGRAAFEQGAEAAQGHKRGRDALGRQPAGGRQVPAEAGQHLLVEDGPDRAAFQPVDDQADRVGADVDDGRVGLARVSRSGTDMSNARGRSFTLWPRPDKLGLVMKYSCAEKALLRSHPGSRL